MLVLLAGASVLAVAGRSLAWSYAGLFTMILGAALLTPLAMIGAARAAGPPLGGLLGLTGRMAARGVVARLSRTGVAVAALMVAVSATVGVGVMIRSFRATVERWLETSLAADVYVSAPTLRTGRGGESTLAPGGRSSASAETPGVVSLGTYRGVRVLSEFGPTQLVALGIGARELRSVPLPLGNPARCGPRSRSGGAAIVSESYAYRHGLAVGRGLRLRTDRGERVFPVAGVFVDYGSDQGVVMVSRRTYDAYWDDRGVSSLGVVVAPGADVERDDRDAARPRRGGAGPPDPLEPRAARRPRSRSSTAPSRSPRVLRLLATASRSIGVLSALMALQLERARELGVLRAQGLTPAPGLAAHAWRRRGCSGRSRALLAVPVGIGLALVLIHVINRRSFGWTIEAVDPAGRAAAGGGLAVAGRARRGLYPALADGADAARARAEGGVTSVRRRHPGVGLLVGVVAVRGGDSPPGWRS